MANELRFVDGDLLFVSGNLAMAEACCCGEEEDTCSLTGTRPDELVLDITSCNATYNGSHLLTNTAGTAAALFSATGYNTQLDDLCWAWYEPTGVNANEYYIFAVDTTVSDVEAVIKKVSCSAYKVQSVTATAWTDLDGLNFSGGTNIGACAVCGTFFPSPTWTIDIP